MIDDRRHMTCTHQSTMHTEDETRVCNQDVNTAHTHHDRCCMSYTQAHAAAADMVALDTDTVSAAPS